MVSATKSVCESVTAGSHSAAGVDNDAGVKAGGGQWARAGS